MDKTSLGNRMKSYEQVPAQKLVRRMPVLMRLDGKAFHTFTRGLEKPYSMSLREAMVDTARELVSGIQGAVFAYIQSDEISILIKDWTTLSTDSWYDNKVQKMVSVSASIATAAFNDCFQHPSKSSLALFDSRVWNLPKEEVANYFIWRQQDATRNSINMLGQDNFSHKSLQGKNVSAVQDMLMGLTPPINWNDQSTWAKRGSCVLRSTTEESTSIVADNEIPIFTANREYIEHLLD